MSDDYNNHFNDDQHYIRHDDNLRTEVASAGLEVGVKIAIWLGCLCCAGFAVVYVLFRRRQNGQPLCESKSEMQARIEREAQANRDQNAQNNPMQIQAPVVMMAPQQTSAISYPQPTAPPPMAQASYGYPAPSPYDIRESIPPPPPPL